jgi:hypothetical protein
MSDHVLSHLLTVSDVIDRARFLLGHLPFSAAGATVLSSAEASMILHTQIAYKYWKSYTIREQIPLAKQSTKSDFNLKK